MIDEGLHDDRGRAITLRDPGGEWRAVADIAPRDDQRGYVAALAARYLLLADREGVWHSLGIYAADVAVGHVMWGVEEGAAWVGGMVVDASEQGVGIGRAAMRTLLAGLPDEADVPLVRLAYHPDNGPAAALYESLGFAPTGEMDGEELVAELDVRDATA